MSIHNFMEKEIKPKVVFSKAEVASLKSLDLENKRFADEAPTREAETKSNEKEIETAKKRLKVKESTDPVLRREQRK